MVKLYIVIKLLFTFFLSNKKFSKNVIISKDSRILILIGTNNVFRERWPGACKDIHQKLFFIFYENSSYLFKHAFYHVRKIKFRKIKIMFLFCISNNGLVNKIQLGSSRTSWKRNTINLIRINKACFYFCNSFKLY